MLFRKICQLSLLLISFNSFAASIIIEIPAISYPLKFVSARLIFNQSETTKTLYPDGDYFRNTFCVNEPGLYKVEVTIELLSGEQLSDWAAGYIYTAEDVSRIGAMINPNCFSVTFSVFWVSGSQNNQPELYNLSVDTSIIKRVSIAGIDSIADVFYNEGLNWCLDLDVHYELLDENYIPWIKYSQGYFRNAITTCQMMFAFHKQYKETLNPDDYRGFINNANWLANNNHEGYYLNDFNFRHDGNTQMKKYWVSAMAQGYAVGALSYAFKVTRDSTYIKEADSVFVTLCHNSSHYWCFLLDNKSYYWLEEYPNADFCHVLNGKMAALWGIFQYYTMSRNKFALRLLEAGIKSIIDNYRIWSVPNANNSYYCLHHNTKLHYHEVHQIQFLAFANRFDLNEFFNGYYCILNSQMDAEPNDIWFTYLPGTAVVNVESPVGWHVEEQTDWISAGMNGNKIIITSEGNLTNQIRSTTMDVIFDNGDREKIVISQEMEYYFRLNADGLEMDAKKDTLFLSYNTNVPDFQIMPKSGWLHADKLNNNLRLIADENQSFNPRTFEESIYYNNMLLSNFEVNQKAIVPYIDLESDTIFINSTDIHEVSVNTNIAGINLLSYNNWLSYGWNSHSNIWLSSVSGNDTGRIYLDSPYLTEELVVVSGEYTSVKDIPDHSGFAVFPNPVHDILQLTAKNMDTYRFELKNLLGVTLTEGIFNESAAIDVSDYKPGIYFIVISSLPSRSYVYKIIIY